MRESSRRLVRLWWMSAIALAVIIGCGGGGGAEKLSPDPDTPEGAYCYTIVRQNGEFVGNINISAWAIQALLEEFIDTNTDVSGSGRFAERVRAEVTPAVNALLESAADINLIEAPRDVEKVHRVVVEMADKASPLDQLNQALALKPNKENIIALHNGCDRFGGSFKRILESHQGLLQQGLSRAQCRRMICRSGTGISLHRRWVATSRGRNRPVSLPWLPVLAVPICVRVVYRGSRHTQLRMAGPVVPVVCGATVGPQNSRVVPSCVVGVAVHTGCAVFCGDVAEAAFVFAGHPGGWLVGGEPADQSSEVLDELRVQTAHRYSCCPRRIDHFSGQLGVLVLRESSGQGVHVDHDLYEVRRLFPSSFDVDDQGVVAPHYDQVGPAPASVADCPHRRKLF